MTASDEAPKAITILCVDDEANILSSLKRLFRPEGYRILTAGGGREGLELLEAEQGQVDLVISDMRMPEMDGAHFLAEVCKKWPEITRILLTGFAEVETTIRAINEGQIYRYIAKPWNDGDVLLLVRGALERQLLLREKVRLEQLTQTQNEELKALNAGLEEKVAQRTAELRRAHERVKRSFLTSIQVFSNLIELRGGQVAGHSSRVANLSRQLAQRLGLSDREVQDVFLAALLHDIGKIGLPDELLVKPPNQMTGSELGLLRRHPIKGEQALMALEELQDAALLIRSHHERFDGEGYPDGISGLSIPFGARILALVNEYDGLVQGSLLGQRVSEADALQFVQRGRGKRYDPQVVDAFIAVLGGSTETAGGEQELSSGQLRTGMTLARDVISREGVVLLTANYVLTEHLITQLRDFERSDGSSLTFLIASEG
jgi:response regulator RpfG family c-di-GMP phosphodiesterase